jgi:hypothetical protein
MKEPNMVVGISIINDCWMRLSLIWFGW